MGIKKAEKQREDTNTIIISDYDDDQDRSNTYDETQYKNEQYVKKMLEANNQLNNGNPYNIDRIYS